jgi:hypothetical protein
MHTTTDQAEVHFFTGPHSYARKAMRPAADSIATGFDDTIRLTEVDRAAEGGDGFRGTISPTDRAMRLDVGAVFALAALATSSPILWVFALAAVRFAT